MFLIIHRDATKDWPQGNTTLVVGDSAVLVVDAAYLPSAAREDIATIRSLTTKPVRFLLNTHWHYDHNNGNAEYARAFPGIHIVAQAETRRIMDVNGPGYFASVLDSASVQSRTLIALKASVTAGRNDSGRVLTARERMDLGADVAARENERREFVTASYVGPSVTFDRTMSVNLGNRDVRFAYAGRGNTPGDAYAWLPRERLLIAGDLVVSPVPFAFNSFPAQWVRALREIRGLGANAIVPGHGLVMRDTEYLDRLVGLLEDAIAQASDLARRRIPVDSAIRRINLERYRLPFTGGDRLLNEWFDALVSVLPERAYREARGQL